MKTRFVLATTCYLALSVPAHGDKSADAYYEEAVRKHGTAPIEEVFALYARAAERGNPYAQYNVAMMYANGEAVNVDYQQAVYWFQKSAVRNFAPARYRLGELYFFGMGGLPQSETAAVRLFRLAAEQGDADAQMNLAVMYAGRHVPEPDAQTALALMERAAEGGHALAAEYRELLLSSTDGLLSEDQYRAYWARQKAFWVDEAAEIGVREAQEAVDRSDSGADDPDRLRD